MPRPAPVPAPESERAGTNLVGSQTCPAQGTRVRMDHGAQYSDTENPNTLCMTNT